MNQSENHDSRRMTRSAAFQAAGSIESMERNEQSTLSLGLLLSLLLLMGAGGV